MDNRSVKRCIQVVLVFVVSTCGSRALADPQPAMYQGPLSAGAHHICGIDASSGWPECWGSLSCPQEPAHTDGYCPLLLFPMTQISSGLNFACGIDTDFKKMYCWHDSASSPNDPEFDNNIFITTIPVQPQPRVSTLQVAAGWKHVCSIDSDGFIHCFGNDDYGQVHLAPSDFNHIYSYVASGGYNSCAIDAISGKATCWGRDEAAQSEPPNVKFVQISMGITESCGLTEFLTIACWGDNHLTPPAGIFMQVSMSNANICGLGLDGTITCTGYNESGQLTHQTGVFTQVTVGGGYDQQNFGGVLGPEVFYGFVCGLGTDNKAYCWGDNEYGQTRNLDSDSIYGWHPSNNWAPAPVLPNSPAIQTVPIGSTTVALLGVALCSIGAGLLARRRTKLPRARYVSNNRICRWRGCGMNSIG